MIGFPTFQNAYIVVPGHRSTCLWYSSVFQANTASFIFFSGCSFINVNQYTTKISIRLIKEQIWNHYCSEMSRKHMYLNYPKKCLYYFFNLYNSDVTSNGPDSLRAIIVFLLCHLDALSCFCISEPHHGHRTDCFLPKAATL